MSVFVSVYVVVAFAHLPCLQRIRASSYEHKRASVWSAATRELLIYWWIRQRSGYQWWVQ